MFAMFLTLTFILMTVVRSVLCELQLHVVNLQIDKLATDVVMQAAAGSYKPVTIVDKSDEPMDTELEQNDTSSAEQSNISSSCVCSVVSYFM